MSLSVKKPASLRLFWWVRVAVTLGLAAYLVWRLREPLAALQIRLIQPAFLGLGVLIATLGVLLSTSLWNLFIPSAQPVRFRHLVAHYLVGMLLNNFLPGGIGGDAARAVALDRATGRTDIAVSSVLMARLSGLWSIVLLAVAAGFSSILWQPSNLSTYLLLVSGSALLVTILITAFLFGAPARTIFRRIPPRWVSWYACLREHRRVPARLAAALGIALLIQVCAITINLLTAFALGLSISAWQLFLSLPLITLVTLLPISIGGFGVREGTYILLLGLTGVTPADALVLSLAASILLTLVTAAGAGISLLLAPATAQQRQDRYINDENPDL